MHGHASSFLISYVASSVDMLVPVNSYRYRRIVMLVSNGFRYHACMHLYSKVRAMQTSLYIYIYNWLCISDHMVYVHLTELTDSSRTIAMMDDTLMYPLINVNMNVA